MTLEHFLILTIDFLILNENILLKRVSIRIRIIQLEGFGILIIFKITFINNWSKSNFFWIIWSIKTGWKISRITRFLRIIKINIWIPVLNKIIIMNTVDIVVVTVVELWIRSDRNGINLILSRYSRWYISNGYTHSV